MIPGGQVPHADLDACEREPLSFSGLIQDVGVLLALPRGAERLSHYSDNLERYFDLPARPGLLLLDDLFQDPCSYFEQRRRSIFERRHYVINNVITNRGVEGDLLLSLHDEHQIYEFEPRTPERAGGKAPRRAPPVTRHADFPAQIPVEYALTRIHALTGYPKIMLYRFLEDESGEVVAELADEQLDHYQGLRFPASDIPRIARRLYIDNPFRLIFDTQGPVARILAAGGDPNIDLSLSTLRSVSPVHIEYLGNMGVRSSASFPVRVLGKLWGLLAMHAPTPTPIPLAPRLEVTRIVEQQLSRRIMDTRIRSDRAHFNANVAHLEQAAEALTALRSPGAPRGPIPDALRTLIDCDAIVVRRSGDVIAQDGPVEAREIEALAALGDAQAPRGQFLTDSVQRFIRQDEGFRRRASGMAYLRVAGARDTATLEILWLRQEQATTVAWAGRPTKVRQVVDGEERISPRKSFAAWHDTMAGVSAPWSSSDQLLASRLAVQVLAQERETGGGH